MHGMIDRKACILPRKSMKLVRNPSEASVNREEFVFILSFGSKSASIDAYMKIIVTNNDAQFSIGVKNEEN